MNEANEVIQFKTSLPTDYDPERGLRTIIVSEMAEKHLARAKDVEALYKAVETKIDAQADYVVWRDSVVKPQREAPPQAGMKGADPTRAEAIRPSLPDADPGTDIIHLWRKKLTANSSSPGQPRKTIRDQGKIAEAKEEAKERCRRICELESVTTIKGTEGTGEFERYTPARYIEAARAVMGAIDLDPASCAMAQKTVKAERFFSKEDDGLDKEWKGRIWLNPPYSKELMAKFVSKLVKEVELGNTTEAILLTNAGTDTEWFMEAVEACTAVCFAADRIQFIGPNGKVVGVPTSGQVFLYFGGNPTAFATYFGSIGFGMVRSWNYEKEAA